MNKPLSPVGHAHKLPAFSLLPGRRTSAGILLGWNKDPSTIIYVMIDDDVVFQCPGCTMEQKRSEIAYAGIGQPVIFYHDGFDRFGRPINPLFKTLHYECDSTTMRLLGNHCHA